MAIGGEEDEEGGKSTAQTASHLATSFQSSSLPVSLLAQLAHTATKPTTSPATTEWLEARAPAKTWAEAFPIQLASQRPPSNTKPLQAPFKSDPRPGALKGAR